MKKFIATHYIMEGVNTGTPGFDYAALNTIANPVTGAGLSANETSGTEVLPVSGKYLSVIIAKNLVIDINEFNRLNPGFDAMLASGKDYNLRLTPEKMDLFVANKYAILNECVQVLLNDVNEPTKTTYNRSSNSPIFKGK